MSMAIKPGYVNPLTMIGKKNNTFTAAPLAQQKSEKEDDVQDLQSRQQALENNILLLKSTTEGAANSVETQEVLQEKLEEIVSELRTAKAQVSQAAVSEPVKENFDLYEKESGQADSPGLYQILPDEKLNRKIIFSPYTEQQ